MAAALQLIGEEFRAKRTYQTLVRKASKYIWNTYKEQDLTWRLRAIEIFKDTSKADVFMLAGEEKKRLIFNVMDIE